MEKMMAGIGCAILNRTYSYSSSEDSLNESFTMPFPLRNSSKTYLLAASRGSFFSRTVQKLI
jgi:hypothetical protein